jgi:hypothetical protein
MGYMTFLYLRDGTKYVFPVATSDFLVDLDCMNIDEELGTPLVLLEPLLGSMANPQEQTFGPHDNRMGMDANANVELDLHMDDADSGRQVAKRGQSVPHVVHRQQLE